MHKTDAANNVGNEFSDGTPPLTPGTSLGAKWHNTIQRELVNVVLTKAGIALDDGDDTQLGQALDVLYGRLAAANTWTDAQIFQTTVAITGLLTASNGQTTGINGVGPATGDSGVLGTGHTTGGTGVVGAGGSSGGVGVVGTGGSTASGVEGTGGSNGDGVRGNGTGSGAGGRFTGGGTAGAGLVATGGGSGFGILGTAGSSGGQAGVKGIGVTTNYGVHGTSPTGVGVFGESTGASTTAAGVSGSSADTGPGVEGTSAAGPGGKFSANGTRGSVNFVPRASDPASPQNGDIWYNSTSHKYKGCENGVVVTFTTT